ncbi:EMILIN-2 [Gadus chalcogrammus]|uniref:EMILIN-2 n=1 Tax=Gadus chalcogrammus TaxID=1042646 RepID=UPI0024C4E16C|nr:EMILIN-2 [Gadus chalcogrammus]
MDWKWTIVTFFLKFYLTSGTPYDLFQGSAYTGVEDRHRNRNWCAYVVHKNVSCAVREGVESFEEPVAAPCPPYQQNCDQQVTYRTQFRPMYKIAFKIVTRLEWKCCPGYQGQDCKDLKPTLNHQTVPRGSQPFYSPNPGHTTRHAQRPERRETGHHEARHGPGPDKVRHLEGEVKRLSQVVVDLQTALSGLTDNLRTDIQEDTNKMLVTLLNNLRPPGSVAPGAGREDENPVGLDGHQATRGEGAIGDRGIENIIARLDDMTHTMQSKDDALEELRGLVTSQESQIQLLMDAAQSQAPPPGVLEGGVGGGGDVSVPDLAILQTYVEGKMGQMRKEVDLNLEEQLGRQQSSCNDKIQSLQAICEEGQDQTLSRLTRLIDSKDAELRKEIHALRFDMVAADGPVRHLRQTLPPKQEPDGTDHKELWKEISRVAEANIILNGRMDNELAFLSESRPEEEYGQVIEELEARLNITQRNAETHCFYIEEKLSRAMEDQANELRQLLDERLNTMEDQFTGMLVEMSNSSGLFGDDGVDANQGETNGNKSPAKGPVVAFGRRGSDDVVGAGRPSPATASLDPILKDLGRCKKELEILHTDVGTNSEQLRNLEEIVERVSAGHLKSVNTMDGFQKGLVNIQNNVIALASSVKGVGDSMRIHNHELHRINSTCCHAGHSGLGTPTGSGPGAERAHYQQMEGLRNRLDTLNNRMSLELGRCKDNTQTVAHTISTVDGRLTRLEKVCERQAVASSNPIQIRDGIERKIASLQGSVQRTNATVGSHTGDIHSLRNSLQSVQVQLSALAKHVLKDVNEKQPGTTLNAETPGSPAPPKRVPHIHIPFIPNPRQSPPSVALPNTHHQARTPHGPPLRPSSNAKPSSPQQPPKRPVLETGEAGPPGFPRRMTVRRGVEDEAPLPLQGFAGAPGHLPVMPVSLKSHLSPVPVAAEIPWNRAPTVQSAVLADPSSTVEPVSFSVGLTQQYYSLGRTGPIRFNEVLVNDGGHYSTSTGMFTAPMDGRYLVSGVLTAGAGEPLVATLSVNDRSVQKLQSAVPALLGTREVSGCGSCGGPVSFSLVLSLKKGHSVGLMQTAGKLASSDLVARSTYSGVFLYTPQSRS